MNDREIVIQIIKQLKKEFTKSNGQLSTSYYESMPYSSSYIENILAGRNKLNRGAETTKNRLIEWLENDSPHKFSVKVDLVKQEVKVYRQTEICKRK